MAKNIIYTPSRWKEEEMAKMKICMWILWQGFEGVWSSFPSFSESRGQMDPKGEVELWLWVKKRQVDIHGLRQEENTNHESIMVLLRIVVDPFKYWRPRTKDFPNSEWFLLFFCCKYLAIEVQDWEGHKLSSLTSAVLERTYN